MHLSPITLTGAAQSLTCQLYLVPRAPGSSGPHSGTWGHGRGGSRERGQTARCRKPLGIRVVLLALVRANVSHCQEMDIGGSPSTWLGSTSGHSRTKASSEPATGPMGTASQACSPLPPLSFEPLSAWVRGREAGLDFGEGALGKHTRRAWQSSPRSRAATVWLGRCNRWPLSAGPWQQVGCRAGTVVRSGVQAWALCSPRANGVTPSLPHWPICPSASLFPLPRSQPLSGGGTHSHIHSHPHIHSHSHIHSHLDQKPSLTDLDTASIPELSSHRGLSHEDIPTDSKSQMHKQATADTNVAGLEMQAQSCEPTCTDHPTRTPEDAMTQPSRLSRNLPSRWAAFEGKSPQASGSASLGHRWGNLLAPAPPRPSAPRPPLTCVPSALLLPGAPRLQSKPALPDPPST